MSTRARVPHTHSRVPVRPGIDDLYRQERLAWATWCGHLAGCAKCQRSYARQRYADASCSAGADSYGRWRVASQRHLSALNPDYAFERGHYA